MCLIWKGPDFNVFYISILDNLLKFWIFHEYKILVIFVEIKKKNIK